MTGARSISGAILAGAAILAAAVAGLRSYLGATPPVHLGMALGAGLGVGGAALEVLLMHRALRRNPAKAMNIVLGGLGIRMVVLLLLTVLFHGTAAVNESAFALAFVAGFMASLPAVGAVTGAFRARDGRSGGSASSGPSKPENGESHA